MNVRSKAVKLLSVWALVLVLTPMIASAQGRTVRITGVVRDEANAIALPGVPVEVVGGSEVVYTDVDGRYVLQVPPGKHQIKVLLDGYQERLINVEVSDERSVAADMGLTMKGLTETVVVHGASRRSGDLVGRSTAHRAQAGAGHYRQHRLPGNERQRRQKRSRSHGASDGCLGCR